MTKILIYTSMEFVQHKYIFITFYYLIFMNLVYNFKIDLYLQLHLIGASWNYPVGLFFIFF